VISIVGFLLNLLIVIYKSLFPFFGATLHLKKLGEWAVVTGATDGIGKAFAEQLAKLGFNIVLISRNPTKLDEVKKNLELVHGIEVLCQKVDFATKDTAVYEEIAGLLKNLNIGILVNNVGSSFEHPEYFVDYFERRGRQAIQDMINLNCLSVSMMTHVVLPLMVFRKRGAILNVSSASGLIPTPFLSVYSATKAYVDFFSKSVQMEYADSGVFIQSICPYFVATKMTGVKRPNWMTPSSESFVGQCLKTVGRRTFTMGCFSHSLMYLVSSMLPASLLSFYITKTMKNMRRRALNRKGLKKDQ